MRKIFLILVLLLNVSLFSQDIIKANIDGYEIINDRTRNTEFSYLTFENAVNNQKFGALPLIKMSYDLPDNLFELDIEVLPISFDTINSKIYDALIDSDLIDNSFQYLIEYQNEKAFIYLLPLRSNGNHLEILTEYKILIHLVPSYPSNKGQVAEVNYADESVLASGIWFKMGIIETGVHKLGFNDITEMGINPSEINTGMIGIFGTYNGVLPESNNVSRYDDLIENSIMPFGLDDGTFDEQDYILFYAQDPTTWKYNPFTGRFLHNINYYSDTTYYFFTPDRGSLKTVDPLEGDLTSPTDQVTTFLDHKYHELNLENMMSTGRTWYGEEFNADIGSRQFDFDFPNIVTDEEAYVGVEFMGRAFENSYYDIFVNDQQMVDSMRIRYITSSLGIFGRESTSNFTLLPDNDNIDVRIDFESLDPNGAGWLDYIVVNAYRDLKFEGSQMKFCNPRVASAGKVGRFIVDNTSQNDIIWDISDIHNPMNVIGQYTEGTTVFTIPADSLKTFVVFDGSEFFSPVSYEAISNQNLHALSNVNYVIIRPDIFADEAERLAELHRSLSGLKTVTVDLDEVYNEFSSGSQDVSAIRDFMRMLDKKGAFGGERAYLMLFGDASFDYKDRVHNNTNLVPTYEAIESLRETGSFVTDDYFGLLDDNEGLNAVGNVDIGIGRFPVTTSEQAKVAVDKVEHYLLKSNKVMRDWRSVITFIADDKDNNTHIKQAEGLAELTDTLNIGIRVNKIYLDSYKKISVPGGYRYPDVNEKIDDQVDKGALIINYTGHGGLIGWSDEMVLDVPMINAFDNLDNLPLIITATCEFSRFDDPEFISAGEYTFLNKNGGAVALLTTTRLAYSHANYIVNRRIYTNLLRTTDDGAVPRLGDLVRLSKIPYDDNFLNFALLGDPGLMLAYPEYNVETTQISSGNYDGDTIHALSIVEVSGEIHDIYGELAEGFNGYLYPKVFDKKTEYWTLGNDGGSYPEQFELYDKILFDGKVSVVDGHFNFEFRVPKDISYKYGHGRIAYYGLDTLSFIDAWGGFDDFVIGGIDEDAIDDNEGPDIGIYLNNTNFESGDIVTSNPVLYSRFYDESGINYTGNGVGRDIVMVLDSDYSNPYIMNDSYEPDVNSYVSGSLAFPFSDLSEGFHTVTIKAWDLNNNSSEVAVEFYVDNNMSISLFNVITQPNPFTDKTQFIFNHNKYGAELDVLIRIYDINGNLVTELNSDNFPDNIMIWDGRNINNSVVSDGVYTYVIQASDNYGNVTLQQQKLIKLSK